MNKGHDIGRSLGRIHRLQLKYLKPLFENTGLPPSCFSYILRIGQKPGISQKMLCESTHVDEAIATRLVKDMVKHGYVNKARNPNDHRAFQLYLTDKGNAFYPQIEETLNSWWQTLLKDLPEEILNQSLVTMTNRAYQLANEKEENKK